MSCIYQVYAMSIKCKIIGDTDGLTGSSVAETLESFASKLADAEEENHNDDEYCEIDPKHRAVDFSFNIL